MSKNIRELTKELERRGFEVLGSKMRKSGHHAVTVASGDQTVKLTVPCTPSCRRWINNTIRDARLALRMESERALTTRN